MHDPLSGRVIRAAVAVAVAAGTAVVAAVIASPAAAATTTFSATADTYVQGSTPTTNYGTSTQFVVDDSPVRRSFLKFTVSGLTAAVTNAKLRIHTISANSGSSNGGTWRSLTDTTWSETGTTWNNQPTIDGPTLATLGSVATSTWYEVDVTSLITG
ncbi:MAG: acid phosphatase type 7, partial [Micromonosporaceae bacterium]|nr:acid phosphatase type 7 [Micromonosporaceae bacterium]